ncbi:MAG TPA: GNAT family N-acetyltransferase [Flavobacterium sp.]|jgi:ribosomal protein S18 acetylase RimI-like enzyme|nr:GNAT family N-acetyltransferase [Flavobacterium sp.]
MVTIYNATPDHYSTICSIARQTWPATYGKILSDAQLGYMLDLFYTEEAILKNVSAGQIFLLASKSEKIIGFASYQLNYHPSTTHIHKIYLLPESQKSGAGRIIIDEIAKRSIAANQTALSLNVNRQNSARQFYENLDFTIEREIDIELDYGYLMEDYIMKKVL